MNEAWIQLRCPACQEDWESNPADLPAPDQSFECPHCGEDASMREFMKTPRALDILAEFHGQ
ncbi:MAG: hypothetical protein ABEJ04_01440 [Halobacteriaceae archaeon]